MTRFLWHKYLTVDEEGIVIQRGNRFMHLQTFLSRCIEICRTSFKRKILIGSLKRMRKLPYVLKRVVLMERRFPLLTVTYLIISGRLYRMLEQINLAVV